MDVVECLPGFGILRFGIAHPGTPRHQHVFDVGEIDADLAQICDQLIDMSNG